MATETIYFDTKGATKSFDEMVEGIDKIGKALENANKNIIPDNKYVDEALDMHKKLRDQVVNGNIEAIQSVEKMIKTTSDEITREMSGLATDEVAGKIAKEFETVNKVVAENAKKLNVADTLKTDTQALLDTQQNVADSIETVVDLQKDTYDTLSDQVIVTEAISSQMTSVGEATGVVAENVVGIADGLEKAEPLLNDVSDGLNEAADGFQTFTELFQLINESAPQLTQLVDSMQEMLRLIPDMQEVGDLIADSGKQTEISMTELADSMDDIDTGFAKDIEQAADASERIQSNLDLVTKTDSAFSGLDSYDSSLAAISETSDKLSQRLDEVVGRLEKIKEELELIMTPQNLAGLPDFSEINDEQVTGALQGNLEGLDEFIAKIKNRAIEAKEGILFAGSEEVQKDLETARSIEKVYANEILPEVRQLRSEYISENIIPEDVIKNVDEGKLSIEEFTEVLQILENNDAAITLKEIQEALRNYINTIPESELSDNLKQLVDLAGGVTSQFQSATSYTASMQEALGGSADHLSAMSSKAMRIREALSKGEESIAKVFKDDTGAVVENLLQVDRITARLRGNAKDIVDPDILNRNQEAVEKATDDLRSPMKKYSDIFAENAYEIQQAFAPEKLEALFGKGIDSISNAIAIGGGDKLKGLLANKLMEVADVAPAVAKFAAENFFKGLDEVGTDVESRNLIMKFLGRDTIDDNEIRELGEQIFGIIGAGVAESTGQVREEVHRAVMGSGDEIFESINELFDSGLDTSEFADQFEKDIRERVVNRLSKSLEELYGFDPEFARSIADEFVISANDLDKMIIRMGGDMSQVISEFSDLEKLAGITTRKITEIQNIGGDPEKLNESKESVKDLTDVVSEYTETEQFANESGLNRLRIIDNSIDARKKQITELKVLQAQQAAQASYDQEMSTQERIAMIDLNKQLEVQIKNEETMLKVDRERRREEAAKMVGLGGVVKLFNRLSRDQIVQYRTAEDLIDLDKEGSKTRLEAVGNLKEEIRQRTESVNNKQAEIDATREAMKAAEDDIELRNKLRAKEAAQLRELNRETANLTDAEGKLDRAQKGLFFGSETADSLDAMVRQYTFLKTGVYEVRDANEFMNASIGEQRKAQKELIKQQKGQIKVLKALIQAEEEKAAVARDTGDEDAAKEFETRITYFQKRLEKTEQQLSDQRKIRFKSLIAYATQAVGGLAKGPFETLGKLMGGVADDSKLTISQLRARGVSEKEINDIMQKRLGITAAERDIITAMIKDYQDSNDPAQLDALLEKMSEYESMTGNISGNQQRFREEVIAAQDEVKRLNELLKETDDAEEKANIQAEIDHVLSGVSQTMDVVDTAIDESVDDKLERVEKTFSSFQKRFVKIFSDDNLKKLQKLDPASFGTGTAGGQLLGGLQGIAKNVDFSALTNLTDNTRQFQEQIAPLEGIMQKVGISADKSGAIMGGLSKAFGVLSVALVGAQIGAQIYESMIGNTPAVLAKANKSYQKFLNNLEDIPNLLDADLDSRSADIEMNIRLHQAAFDATTEMATEFTDTVSQGRTVLQQFLTGEKIVFGEYGEAFHEQKEQVEADAADLKNIELFKPLIAQFQDIRREIEKIPNAMQTVLDTQLEIYNAQKEFSDSLLAEQEETNRQRNRAQQQSDMEMLFEMEDWALERLNAWDDHLKNIGNIEDDYISQIKDLEDEFNTSRQDAYIELNDNLKALDDEEQQSRLENQENYAQEDYEALVDHLKSLAEAEDDYRQDRIRREEDLYRQLGDIEMENDALSYLKTKRDSDIEFKRSEEDHQASMKDQEDQFAEQRAETQKSREEQLDDLKLSNEERRLELVTAYQEQLADQEEALNESAQAARDSYEEQLKAELESYAVSEANAWHQLEQTKSREAMRQALQAKFDAEDQKLAEQARQEEFDTQMAQLQMQQEQALAVLEEHGYNREDILANANFLIEKNETEHGLNMAQLNDDFNTEQINAQKYANNLLYEEQLAHTERMVGVLQTQHEAELLAVQQQKQQESLIAQQNMMETAQMSLILGPFGALVAKGKHILEGTDTLFAEGGNPEPNKPAVVGEEGPELMVPKGQSTIIPSGLSKQLIGTFAGGRVKAYGSNVDFSPPQGESNVTGLAQQQLAGRGRIGISSASTATPLISSDHYSTASETTEFGSNEYSDKLSSLSEPVKQITDINKRLQESRAEFEKRMAEITATTQNKQLEIGLFDEDRMADMRKRYMDDYADKLDNFQDYAKGMAAEQDVYNQDSLQQQQSYFTDMLSTGDQGFGDLVTGYATSFQSMIDEILGRGKEEEGGVASVAKNIFDTIKGIFSEDEDTREETLKGVVESGKEFVGSLMDRFQIEQQALEDHSGDQEETQKSLYGTLIEAQRAFSADIIAKSKEQQETEIQGRDSVIDDIIIGHEKEREANQEHFDLETEQTEDAHEELLKLKQDQFDEELEKNVEDEDLRKEQRGEFNEDLLAENKGHYNDLAKETDKGMGNVEDAFRQSFQGINDVSQDAAGEMSQIGQSLDYFISMLKQTASAAQSAAQQAASAAKSAQSASNSASSSFFGSSSSSYGSSNTTWGSLSAFAEGGDIDKGEASFVGEEGPEIYVPDNAGTIISNRRSGGNSFGDLAKILAAENMNVMPRILDEMFADTRSPRNYAMNQKPSISLTFENLSIGSDMSRAEVERQIERVFDSVTEIFTDAVG